ncbi:LacI family DNA-binding transcriptional regulator [Halomonas cupida]|uniref:LacI family DNA-binding transcriptional regulator n=1 Tax=Halomonas TaxID=2745 RepID=UPI001C98815A|nr:MULTISPECIES: LacI family DNA-binding transcriptional regulator [unclassified Halomonas]MBY5929566.1 LacI family DNA-binding transcriptional regulator [Halomonas sp. DP8Y7-3]MBY5983964.1 LacI family DNA-binding transcriptional regulator [Halomonas sp. DP5Y7-2]
MSEPQGGDRRRRKGLDNPTLDDVAREAGVSAITVSRAIHRPDSVREATREKVEAAIAKVGYVPNMVAGTLASASSRFIPVIVPSLSNVVFVEVIQGLQAVFDQHGYQMLLGNTDYSMEREEELIRTFLGWSPTALVTTGLRHREGLSELLKRFPRPLVEIMELGQAVDMNVGMDHQRAGATMADHLLAQGYRHIVFAGTRLAHNYRAAQRYEGHRSRLVSEGLDAPLMEWQQDSHYDLGGAALDDIRRQYPQVEAIHFIDDVMASGALLEAQRQGLRVPDDIAIAGFTGLPFARALIPRLTTIVSPREAIGRLAAHQIIDRLEGRQPEACIDVGFTLQRGEST